MKDVLFTEIKTEDLAPTILGKTDTGLRLYQKILVLLLSSNKTKYRATAGTSLVSFFGQVNITGNDFLQTLGNSACSQALSLLDTEDAALIKQLKATAQYSKLYITIELTDGTTYTGALTI